MKYYLLGICLLLSVLAYSQPKPWGTPSSVWYYNDPPVAGDPTSNYYSWEVLEDTLINGKPCGIIGDSSVVEYMYEEDGEVFYWKYEQFRKVYDFSAEQGDTLVLTYKAALFNSSQTDLIDTVIEVSAIVDSIWISSIPPLDLKTFRTRTLPSADFPEISHWPIVTYTERIGSHGEMIQLIFEGETIVPFPKYLRCYVDAEIDHTESWWLQQNKPCDYRLGTGIEQNDGIKIAVTPNPVSELLRINTDREGCYFTVLYDLMGREMLTKTFVGNTASVDVKAFPTGVYLLLISNENTSISTVTKILLK